MPRKPQNKRKKKTYAHPVKDKLKEGIPVRRLQPWEILAAEFKEKHTKLQRGEKHIAYRNWQDEYHQVEEGMVTLLEFERWHEAFTVWGKTWQGERWLVEFENGFRTHRWFRVQYYLPPV